MHSSTKPTEGTAARNVGATVSGAASVSGAARWLGTLSRAAAAATIAASMAFAGAACDTTAKFTVDEVRIDPASPFLIVSATPLSSVSTEGGVPACNAGDGIEGFRLDFIIKSTAHEGTLTGNQDLQVRDGDRVSGIRIALGETISANNFTFGTSDNVITRAESYNAANSQSFPQVSADPRALQFTARNASRSQPVAVAVIVDHSGSMRGNVDPNKFYEVRNNSYTPTAVSGAATDPFFERYAKLASQLLWTLNDNDRAIAWFINDEGVNLACSAPELSSNLANSPRIDKERFCFQSRNRIWTAAAPGENSAADAFDTLATGSGTVDGIDVRVSGRTPLWTAVNHAYQFLSQEAPADVAKHIVVLTDSPDTCDQTGPYWVPEVELCSTGEGVTRTGYSEFRASLLSEPIAANRIPVSFLQLQSLGYQDPDPAQQEVACLTNGTYQWINALDIAKGDTGYSAAIEDRILRIRYTLGGVWSLFVEASGSLPQFTPDAQHILLEGTVTLNPKDLPIQNQATQQFRPGLVDTRLMLRKTCASEAECGGTDGDCVQGCLTAGNVCVVDTSYAPPWNTQEPGCCCGSTEPVDQCLATVQPCCVADPQVHLLCQ